MQIQHRVLSFVLCAIMLGGAANLVRAADGEDDRWQLITTPFLWGTGLEGDMTIHGRTVEVDLGFDDLLEVTDYGFMTYLELRKKKFGFYASPSYMKLSGDAHPQRPRASADFEQHFWLVEGGAFYNLVDTGGDKPFILDLIAGVRYWNIDTEVNIQGEGPLGRELSIGSLFEVTDPIVGVRLHQHITSKLSFAIRGDLGGFHISEGDTSDFSWHAMGLLGYDLSQRFTLLAGYRALGIETDEGTGTSNKGVDLIFQGLMLGLQVRW